MSTQSSDEKLIAVLQSAKAPTDKQRSRLLAFLKRTYGQEPELTWQQDDSLEKGFRLKAGSDVYDWSLEGRMRQFQERMQQLEPGQENIVPLMRQAIENWTPAAQAEEKIDFSKVQIEPLFADFVDFETFSKSDFRAVKVLACEAVKKSKKLLKFTLDDGSGTPRTILSGIHAYYEPEELVGKTCIAITNLPPRPMMGIDSCGMLISAVHSEEGEERLHLLMVDPHIPAGAKLY